MTVLLAGATGLIGGLVLEHFPRHPVLDTGLGSSSAGREAKPRVKHGVTKEALARNIIPVARRPIVGYPGVVADFDDLPPLPPARVAVCALGTTRAKAGSDAAFRAVDHDAVLAFARAAQTVGVSHFIVVTAIGADARSRLLYPRTKGEVEAALEQMRFARLDILQPGLLIGPRAERRPVEALLQRLVPLLNPILPAAMGSLPAAAVAHAIIALSTQAAPGVFRHDNRAIQRLAGRGFA